MLGSKEIREFDNQMGAWDWIHNNYPGVGWYLDHESSKNAGYNIWRNTEEYYDYICDLGKRLEVNIKEGNQTINLWYDVNKEENEEPDVKGSETATWYKLTNSEVARICNRIYTVVAAAAKGDNERGTYDNMYEIMEDLKLIDRLRNPTIDESEGE